MGPSGRGYRRISNFERQFDMPTKGCEGRYEGRGRTPEKDVEVDMNDYTRMFSTVALVFLSVIFCMTAMLSEILLV